MKLFYICNCLGQNGASIKVPKIKTMRDGAEDELAELVADGQMNKDRKIENDPRVIPSRRWLRRGFIDETPQILYNLFWKRNMRLVGERPKSETYWEGYPRQFKARSLKSKPGFLGVHKYNSLKPCVKVGRKYQAEKKLRPVWTDIKYGSVIIFNILTGRARGA
jgi:lipopolysaccharide/colanic/teichoic acid biosynthesis glycosyltransferase